ncbi:T6SS immunity protein Tdi1 domain-containing protein [Humidisolicoccus flavus]|uniref:T6SS immunity protein Tdi1 domain-containing protein n=1 Tax=Humidisolicoccus flavus TaxID=3111414 RepID=UPI003247D4E8
MSLDSYVPAGNVSSNTVEKYGELVPLSVEKAWRATGTMMTEDGFARLVDPVAFEDLLPEILPNLPGAYAVMATGFGDLLVVHDTTVYVVFFRLGFYMQYLSKFGAIVPISMTERASQEKILLRTTYDEGVARLGVPKIDECLGYTLPLAMGGPQTAENLSLRPLREHLIFLVSVGGVPRHFDEVHPPSNPDAPAQPNAAAPGATVSPDAEASAAQAGGSSFDVARLEQVAYELFEKIGVPGPFGTRVYEDEQVIVVSYQIRGGVSILVGADESVLYFPSAVSPSDAVQNYLNGDRTDRAKFKARSN